MLSPIFSSYSSIGRATDLCIFFFNKFKMLTTKQKGNITELQCMTAFIENKCNISIPYGDNCKYDFIPDIENNLYKIQVKTCRPVGENDAITFSCRTTHVNCNETKNEKYSATDIDYFTTYWDNQCFLIPVNECGSEKTLRLNIPKNGQINKISFAEEYKIEKIIKEIKETNKEKNI